jgi:hypothetical protein
MRNKLNWYGSVYEIGCSIVAMRKFMKQEVSVNMLMAAIRDPWTGFIRFAIGGIAASYLGIPETEHQFFAG